MFENHWISRWLWSWFVCSGNFHQIQIIPNAIKKKIVIRYINGIIIIPKNKWLNFSKVHAIFTKRRKDTTLNINKHLRSDDWVIKLRQPRLDKHGHFHNRESPANKKDCNCQFFKAKIHLLIIEGEIRVIHIKSEKLLLHDGRHKSSIYWLIISKG